MVIFAKTNAFSIFARVNVFECVCVWVFVGLCICVCVCGCLKIGSQILCLLNKRMFSDLKWICFGEEKEALN